MSSEQLRPPPRTYDYSSGADSQYSDSSYPQGSTPFLIPPSGPFPEHSPSHTPRESSYGAPDPAYNSDPLLGSSDAIASTIPNAYLAKEGYAVHTNPSNWHVRKPLYKRPLFWFGALVALAVVVLAVVLPIIFVVVKPNQHHNTSANTGTNQNSDPGSSSTGGNGDPASSTGATTGGDGSTVTTADGSTVSDPKNPFDNSARPNSWTPPLNTSWTWGEDHIYGVNLGGLFVLEPFIVPTIYQESTGAVDEWTLSTLLSQNGSLQSALEDHYNTFITEQDIAEIAGGICTEGAGLNWIRLPIPFWAIETWADVGVDASGNNVAEPFLAQVCWKYILRVIGWARKYGIRINLDLHTAPGSQNGYNHSGKLGQVNFLNGPMGIANAERMLDYIRIITEFISQPEYKDVIPMFGIINEALLSTIGRDQLSSFYLRAHDMIRSITGIGAGNGPFISIHDGFQGMSSWAGFLTGSDRIALDTHPYFAFDGQPNTQPINVTAVGGDGVEMGGVWPKQACNSWGPQMNASRNNFGVSIAGEFSNGYNDCGLFVEGVGGTPHFVGTARSGWTRHGCTGRLVLLDVEDRQLDGEHRAIAALVVSARSSGRMDADGSPDGIGQVRALWRVVDAVRWDVPVVADRRSRRGDHCGDCERVVWGLAPDDDRECGCGVADADAAVHEHGEPGDAAGPDADGGDGELGRWVGGPAGYGTEGHGDFGVCVSRCVERAELCVPDYGMWCCCYSRRCGDFGLGDIGFGGNVDPGDDLGLGDNIGLGDNVGLGDLASDYYGISSRSSCAEEKLVW
ncbi:putative glucan 1,3-beta-glucosidase D [Grifola frondosa]|uniref:glucan 1,3-beta-glucosidase n=1 Tax=Grifola frondosa TaxID=5627 RepID=A0A1C7LP29_GRIFR|nr:putative glucan 1,3-beta-glucosidase D [Grifola frondosa]